MTDRNERRESARQALFSGKLDIEGMDDVLALYRDLSELTEKVRPLGKDHRELTSEEAGMKELSNQLGLVLGERKTDGGRERGSRRDPERLHGRFSGSGFGGGLRRGAWHAIPEARNLARWKLARNTAAQHGPQDRHTW